MKHVAILCGGSTYEHEVSIISGIQVAEALDKSQYTFSFVYFDKDNQPFLLKNFKTKADFKRAKRIPIDFAKRDKAAVLVQPTLFNRSVMIDVCYLAFHGGSGESGPVQGLLELLNVPYTSPSQEGSVIAMNKALTKEVLRAHNLPTLDSFTVNTLDYERDKTLALQSIQKKFDFPIIIKPVHLGSSIAIEIAHNAVELEKYLNVAVHVDSEILLEPALENFTEYNVSVRSHNGELELSPIEEPKREADILSFADKYTKGSKKTGSKQTGGGMELLDRTVPAKISNQLTQEIRDLASAVYRACRLSGGPVRIDFMYHDEKLYCTEVNPIPGSMSFYLWEATGEQFREQIKTSLEDAIARQAAKVSIEPYETDIVEKFIG